MAEAAERRRTRRAGSLPTTPTLKPGAEKFRVVRGADDTGQYSSCLPPGIPQSFFVPYYIQIVQAPKHVVVAHEYLNLFRIIPTDGRAAAGGSRSVVDGQSRRPMGRRHACRGLDRLQRQDRDQRLSPHGVAARRRAVPRPDFDTLQYEATIEDPNVFAGPWVIRRTFPLLTEYDAINEFVCENNRDYKPLFGKTE